MSYLNCLPVGVWLGNSFLCLLVVILSPCSAVIMLTATFTCSPSPTQHICASVLLTAFVCLSLSAFFITREQKEQTFPLTWIIQSCMNPFIRTFASALITTPLWEFLSSRTDGCRGPLQCPASIWKPFLFSVVGTAEVLYGDEPGSPRSGHAKGGPAAQQLIYI